MNTIPTARLTALLATPRRHCICCAWRWDTQESYDDHVDYMATIGCQEVK